VVGLEVHPPVAGDLFYIVFPDQGTVAPPLVGRYFRVPCDMGIEHLLELLCRIVLDLHRVHPPYLALVGQLHRADRLFLLAVVAPAHLALFPASRHELVYMHRPSIGWPPLGFMAFLTLCMNRRAVFSVIPKRTPV